MKTEWSYRCRAGKYYVWSQYIPLPLSPVGFGEKLAPVFQVTESDTPPTGDSGYHDLNALLRLKGVSL